MNPNSYYADDYAYGSRRSPNPSGASGYSHAHRADNYNDPSSQRADYETFPPPQAASSHRDDYAQNNAMPAGGNAYPPENPNGDGYDHESQSYYSSDKLTAACDVSIRHGFIRKVFSIVGIQLLFTFSVSLPFLLIASWGSFLILNYTWLLIIAFILVIVPMIVLSCFRGISRSFPQNYIMLFLLTFGMTIIVSIAGSVTAASSFAIAAGITAAVSIGLIIFAIQTRIDFTSCWVFAFVAAIVMMVFFVLLIFMYSRVLHLIYASLGALLMSFYIVYDTQLIVGGKHRKYEYSIDDYVFAAMSLYLDIINLFLYLLQILNLTN